MELRRRVLYRVHRLFVYWGLVDHPYGREYAKAHYTPLGNLVYDGDESGAADGASSLAPPGDAGEQ